jgi:acetoin utilization deacetylase AcuC-like enzyme
MFGGYCFLNNAAIAAQWFRDNGIDRVTILDVDFHQDTTPLLICLAGIVF